MHAAPLLASLLLLACTDRTGGEAQTGTSADTTSGTTSGATTTTGVAADPTTPEPGPTTTQPDPTTTQPDPTDADTGPLDNPSGPCRPVDGDGACPTDYICCSDDPAAVGGRLPNYFDDDDEEVFGAPIFSGPNNALSHSGQCVDVGDFPSPFASGCGVPCNPRWTEEQRLAICGVSSQCCSFTAVDPAKDCVLDPATSRWRAVRGSDIPALSTWGAQHTTNQDPAGQSCETFATVDGVVDMQVLSDCFMQLGVADTRGFCFAACPCTEDLCDQKNPDYVPRCGR